jgi:hypothetical protein
LRSVSSLFLGGGKGQSNGDGSAKVTTISGRGIFPLSWLFAGSDDVSRQAGDIVRGVNAAARARKSEQFSPSSSIVQVNEMNQYECLSGSDPVPQQTATRKILVGYMEGYDPLAAAKRRTLHRENTFGVQKNDIWSRN